MAAGAAGNGVPAPMIALAPTRVRVAACTASLVLFVSSVIAAGPPAATAPATAPSPATATSVPTADEMIAAIKAVTMPRFDPSRQTDAEYVGRVAAEIDAANAEQTRRRLAFVRAYPTHKWAAGSMFEAVRAAGRLGDPPLRPLADELLALPLSRDTKVMLRITVAEAMARANPPDVAGADAQLASLRREVPGDERVAFLAFTLASGSGNPARLRAVVADFPGTVPAAMAAGQLRQLEGIGKPFELAFDDAATGRRVDVRKDLTGKVVVVDFWATWCGPCVAQLPHLKALYAKYKDRGVEFVGVSLDRPAEGGRDKLLAFLAERQVPWPQYYQGAAWEGEFTSSWGIDRVPTLFVIDRAGNLAHITDGNALPDVLEALTAPASRPAGAL